MTQEDKQLVLIDLSARLFYGVICQVDNGAAGLEDGKLVEINISKELAKFDADYYWGDVSIDDVKPYLRPMSSMTEEERKELRQEQIKDEQLFTDCIKNHPEMRGLIIPHFAADWCDKNMFDYRGLIEKGLVIKASE